MIILTFRVLMLLLLLGGGRLSSDELINELKSDLVMSAFTALRLGVEQASQWIPRLLQVIEKYPDTASVFSTEVRQLLDY